MPFLSSCTCESAARVGSSFAQHESANFPVGAGGRTVHSLRPRSRFTVRWTQTSSLHSVCVFTGKLLSLHQCVFVIGTVGLHSVSTRCDCGCDWFRIRDTHPLVLVRRRPGQMRFLTNRCVLRWVLEALHGVQSKHHNIPEHAHPSSVYITINYYTYNF